MRINIEKFKEFLKKSTINFSIDSVAMDVTSESIVSKMRSIDGNVQCYVNKPNDVIRYDGDETYSFAFYEPRKEVIPYLNVFDEEEINLRIRENGLTLSLSRQRGNIGFIDKDVISQMISDRALPRVSFEYFFDKTIDEELILIIKKILTIGQRFGKVYIFTESGKIYIETSDRSVRNSNGITFEIGETEKNGVNMMFDYSHFRNLMKTIERDEESYSLKITWLDDDEFGLIYLQKNDESEHYFLRPSIDNI